MRKPAELPSLGQLALGVGAAAGVLLLGAGSRLFAGEPTPLAAVEIRDGTVEPPAVEIPPGGKMAFTVRAAEEDLRGRVLLRFEAVIPFVKEAGYTSSARITVGGQALDDSHFPVNWADQRTWSLPAVRPGPLELYASASRTWTVRYDNDRWPPAEDAFYCTF